MIKVFMLDDDPLIIRICKLFLDKIIHSLNTTYDFTAMVDPIQAMFHLSLSSDQYHLIILDMQTGILNGDEVFKSMVYISPSCAKKVVFITGFAEDLKLSLKGESFKNIAEPFILEKPFKYKFFIKAVLPILT